MAARLGDDAAGQCEVARVADHVLAHRRYTDDRDAVALALVDELAEARDGLMLMRRPDEDLHGHTGSVQADALLGVDEDRLVGEVVLEHAATAGDAQHDGCVDGARDVVAQHAAREHQRVGVRRERHDRLATALEARGGAEKVAVVHGEHDGTAVGRLDDPVEAVLKTPRHRDDLPIEELCGLRERYKPCGARPPISASATAPHDTPAHARAWRSRCRSL